MSQAPEKLNPCPFCGSCAAVVIERSPNQFVVFCDSGPCSVSTAVWGGRQPAIVAWNRRAPEVSLRALAAAEKKGKAAAEAEIADMIERRSTEGYFCNYLAKQAIVGWVRGWSEEDDKAGARVRAARERVVEAAREVEIRFPIHATSHEQELRDALAELATVLRDAGMVS